MSMERLTPEQEAINQKSFDIIAKTPISKVTEENKFEFADAIGKMKFLVTIETPKDKNVPHSDKKSLALESIDSQTTLHLFTSNKLEETASPFRILDDDYEYEPSIIDIEEIKIVFDEIQIEDDFLTMIHNGPTGNDTLTLTTSDIDFIYDTAINPTTFLGNVDDPFRTIIQEFGRKNKKIKNIYGIRTYDKLHAENYKLDLYIDFENGFDETQIQNLYQLLIDANTKLSATLQVFDFRIFSYEKPVASFIKDTHIKAIIYHRLSPWDNIKKLTHSSTHKPL